MKKESFKYSKSIILCIVILSISSNAQNGGRKVETWYDFNKTIIKEIYFTKSDPPYEMQGNYKKWNEDKNLILDINYDDNLFDGECKLFQDDGKTLIKKEIYSKGKLNGLCEYYHLNGNLSQKSEYKEDELNGTYKSYFLNSNLNIDCIYSSGKKNGIYTDYFQDGKIKTKCKFNNDELDGDFKEYYKTGILKSEATYKNNKKNGIVSNYFKNGNKEEEMSYVLDKPEGLYKVYDESGWLYTEAEVKQGKCNGITKVYFPDGNIKMELNYVDGKVEGTKRSYYQNGKVFCVSEMKNNQVNGSRTLTSITGKFNIKAIYKDNIIIQPEYVKIDNAISTQFVASMNGLKSLPLKVVSDSIQNIHISFELERTFGYSSTEDSLKINVLMVKNIYCKPKVGNIIAFYFPNEKPLQLKLKFNENNNSHCVSLSYTDFYSIFSKRLAAITVQCFDDKAWGELDMIHTFSAPSLEKKLNKFEKYNIAEETNMEFQKIAFSLKD